MESYIINKVYFYDTNKIKNKNDGQSDPFTPGDINKTNSFNNFKISKVVYSSYSVVSPRY